MKEKPGVIFYWGMFEVLLSMPAPQMDILMHAIWTYSKLHQEPELKQGSLAQIMWPMFRQQIDADTHRYQQVSAHNQIKGWTSYFKQTYAPQNGIDPNDREALNMYIRMRQLKAEKGDEEEDEEEEDDYA